jgi:predicted SAM-dependent methyltransferase
MFEHFYPSELFQILSEAYRVLKQSGGIRILVPSLENAIHAYLGSKKEWFPNFPSAYESMGGRFSNFLLCDGQHRLIFDFSFLHELLKKAGFSEIVREEVQRSALFSKDFLEKTEDKQAEYIQTSLIVEAMK